MKKKEKKTEKAGRTGRTGKKLNKKLMVIPVVLLAAAVLAGYIFLSRRAGQKTDPEPDTAAVPADASGEEASSSGSGENASSSGSGEPEPEPEPETEPTKTVSESVDYIKSLSPGALGLEGDSMEAYEIIPKGDLVLVDGVQCMEVFVYKTDENTGTNRFMGCYLLDRGAGGQLYKLDQDSGTAVPVDLTGAVSSG